MCLRRRSFLLVYLMMLWLGAGWVYAQDKTSGPWVMQSSGTKAGLRGIHAVGGGVAWASGTNGTVLRTEDSGYMWQSCAMPPGAEKLDFRGIWAWDANTAIVMSSGTGDLSRLYKTTDGCSHWTLLFTNPDKDGFWDAVAFSDRKNGFVLGDPVHGGFVILRTGDGGKSWIPITSPGLAAGNQAGAFAASNSAMALSGPVFGEVWAPRFGSGGQAGPWVYLGGIDCTMGIAQTHPEVCLERWDFQKADLPMARGNASSGIFSLGFFNGNDGVAVGGDYTKPSESAGTAAWTADGGAHWTAAERPPHGYRSAVAWDEDAKAWIAVGPNGSDVSYDGGKTWSPLDSAPGGGNWNALSLPWVVGPEGRIAKLGELKR